MTRLSAPPGVRLVEAPRRGFTLAETVSLDTVAYLLAVLHADGQPFAVYDPAYPSPSDPGAYLSYSPAAGRPEVWRMTLGNHGWTGGIYEIDAETVARQLRSLAAQSRLQAVGLDAVHFFAHRPPQSAARNREMVGRLRGLHPDPSGPA